ncbi:MAG: hypothetical protein RSB66_03650 [Clostridium sp.]
MNYKINYIKIGIVILLLIWIISFGVFSNKRINGYEGCNNLIETNINYGQGIYLYVKQSPYINDRVISASFPDIKGGEGIEVEAEVATSYKRTSHYDVKTLCISLMNTDGTPNNNLKNSLKGKTLSKVKLKTLSGKEFICDIGRVYISEDSGIYDSKYNFGSNINSDGSIVGWLGIERGTELIGMESAYLDEVFNTMDIYLNDKKITRSNLPVKFNEGAIKLKIKLRDNNNTSGYDVRSINLGFKFKEKSGKVYNSYINIKLDEITESVGISGSGI